MFKVESFGESWIDFELPFPCEVHHCVPKSQPSPVKYSVLTHYTEPTQLKFSSEDVRRYHSLFDLILTSDEELLDLDNAKLALWGSRWVTELPSSKRFEVSFLYSGGVGSENFFRGYRDRRALWMMGDRIEIEKRFYTSVMRPPSNLAFPNPYPYSSKNTLFESMFTVVIENEYIDNWFTEKLIDALSTYTVPIYLGCPNVHRYFSSSGIILPSSIEDIPRLLNDLTPVDYWSRMPFLLENFVASKRFWDATGNMRSYILEAFNEAPRHRFFGGGLP